MKHFETEINLFIDNELEESEQEKLFGHLATCLNCREKLSRLILLKERTNKIISDELTGLISVPRKENKVYKISFYAATAAAAVLLIIVLSFKPKEKLVIKNEIRVDTVFVRERNNVVNTKKVTGGIKTPGVIKPSEQSNQKEYLRYVMNLRKVEFNSGENL